MGKMDAKKHLDTQLNQLMSANILQCMCAPLLLPASPPTQLQASQSCPVLQRREAESHSSRSP